MRYVVQYDYDDKGTPKTYTRDYDIDMEWAVQRARGLSKKHEVVYVKVFDHEFINDEPVEKAIGHKTYSNGRLVETVGKGFSNEVYATNR